ncbi:MAG TPA: BON domain-containing protein [Methylomirabilota bacterium]|nr:BON domain-containing protein [Methylomirabilota bacterium]
MKKALPIIAAALAFAGCAQQDSHTTTGVADDAENASVMAANNTGGNVGTPGPAGREAGSGSSADEEASQGAVAPGTLNESSDPAPKSDAGVAPARTLSATDRALMSRVRNNLLSLTDSQGPAVSSETLNNLQIEAHRGIVTLKGNVKNEAEKQVVADRVQRMDGVVVVKNDLQVAGGQPPLNVGGAGSQQSGKERESTAKAAQEKSPTNKPSANPTTN